MRKFKVTLLVVVAYLLIAPFAVYAAKINFPDILGYKTLKCDFHMHTVFSDGQVWPTTRVDEAVREGLDAIAITDHIEYQPHKGDVPTNHGRSNEIASGSAKKRNILFPIAAEITRDTPPGHFNALFLQDVNALDTEDFLDAMKAANDQNAFVFWNHPDWKPEHIGWFDVHDTLYENKWVHGIEVANGDGYHLNGHKWGLEKNFTMLGTSDMHAPSLITETTPENHRTMTLVFVKEPTLEALKEALVKGRTAVWFKDQLIAKENFLDAIFKAAVKVTDVSRRGDRKILLEIANYCDLNIKLQRTGMTGPEEFLLPAMDKTTLKIRVQKGVRNIELSYVASNMLVAPDKGLPVKLTASAE
ncbi:MAG: histidinol-phosphatase [Planctomycetes bacterium B3_Pla]|nr:MAG: histidinol-phosphatase [Planctomycetes bacterium B3_Pla]